MSTRVRLRDETGLSLYEVLVAILVLVVGMMGVYVSIGTTNGAVAAGEKTRGDRPGRPAAARECRGAALREHREQLGSPADVDHGQLGPDLLPHELRIGHLLFLLRGPQQEWYRRADRPRRDERQGHSYLRPTKQVVADPNASTCASTNTSTCRIVVSVYTFITNVPPSEESACTNTSSCYKRITVAVKNTGQGPPRQPYYLSTFIGPKGGGGLGNPLTSRYSTTCNDQGQVVVCTH